MPRSPKPVAVLLNAMHTTGGGGLVYLQGILPHLARDTRFTWHLLAPHSTFEKLEVPAHIVRHVAPDLRFGVSHLWEQIALPIKARMWGCKLVLSNANYGPLLAPRAGVILHTTPRAATAWKGTFWAWYWRILRVLTTACVARAPVYFSVANHIVADYAAPRKAKRVLIAPPAFNPTAIAHDAVRDPNLVLAVGDFYPQKNYALLIKAFAKLREAHATARLVIIGRPVQLDVRDEVLALAREYNVLEALTLIPGVPHAHLMKMMAQAAVYVSTSSAEAFNMPVLEAMANGTPVVVLDTPFQREVAGEDAAAGAIFVEPNSGDTAAALAIALLGVLANPPIAATMAKRGRARAVLFGWDKTAATITGGLAKVLKVR